MSVVSTPRVTTVFASIMVGLVGIGACDSDESPTLPTNSGTLIATIQTVGTAQDPDGYTVTTMNSDTTIVAMVQINDTLRYENMPTGAYTVGISGLAANCSVNEDLWNVTVVNNSVAEAPFGVACVTP